MRRVTLALPADFYEDLGRAARRHGTTRSRYAAMLVAYGLGRSEASDEIAAIHDRLNRVEARDVRKR